MICPNCGRRNSSGATFCSRCRQRLPLATKLNGNHRRTQMVEPRGGGGSGAIVLGVALLAGFLFIGGAAAIYLSNPPPSGGDGTDISFASSTPSLPIFVQPTATPNASPTFILLPSDSPSFTPLPTLTGSLLPTAQPSSRPPTPTPDSTQRPVVAKFTWSQVHTSMKVTFNDGSSGGPTQWHWTFGDSNNGTSTEQNPTYTYPAYGSYTVKLIVTGPSGTSTRTKTINVQAPPCDQNGKPPGCIPTPSPSPIPTPTEAPTETPPTSAPSQALPASSESPTP